MSVDSDMPMFGFLVLSFLLICALLAFAIWFATRGAADPGRSRVSGPAGCAIGCALLVVGGLGALAVVAVVVRAIVERVERDGDFDGFRWHFDSHDEDGGKDWGGEVRPIPPPAPESPDTRSGTVIELAPGVETGAVTSVLRRELKSALDLSVRTVERDGEARIRITIAEPADDAARAELRELARRLESDPASLGLEPGTVREVRSGSD